MLTLIENGEVFAPRALGRQAVLLVDSRIGKVGAVDRRAVEAVGVECELVDASGCCVCPGLIDPHEHLLGGSGEEGFSTQTPEIFLAEIACAGITTVVGTLGVDVTMKTLPGLLAKAKGPCEEGLDAHVWTGGYNVPPQSVMAGVRGDIMFISEVIGVGEVAIADERGMDPDPRALARIVKGALEEGKLGDVALLDRGTLAVRDVWSRGVRLVRDGALVKRAAWLGESKREIHLTGGEAR